MNINYEQEVKLPRADAYKIAKNWLENNGSSVKEFKEQEWIQANHGSGWINTEYDPNSKKKMRINFLELSKSATLIRIDVKPSILTDVYLKNKLKTVWWDGFFSKLFIFLNAYNTDSNGLTKIDTTVKKNLLEVIEGVIKVSKIYAEIKISELCDRSGYSKQEMLYIVEDLIQKNSIEAHIRDGLVVFKPLEKPQKESFVFPCPYCQQDVLNTQKIYPFCGAEQKNST